MFKKKQDEEWFIGDDEFFEEIVEETEKKFKKSVTSINESIKKERKPNPLRKRDTDVMDYEPYDDYVVEMDEPVKKIAKWKVILPTIMLIIITIGTIGYFSTDFDNNGNMYIVPLELHYERKYIKETDELLELILSINKTIESDTAQLPNNYVNMSSKLNNEMSSLKAKTTKFSKYVGVPTKFNGYHTQLINFSLSTQQLVSKLVKNYNDADYESFREEALKDYYKSLNKVKQARSEIDNIIFRNIEEDINGTRNQ